MPYIGFKYAKERYSVGKGARRSHQAGKPIHRERVIDEQGGIIELAIWQVPKSTDYPEGIRYRCAYVSPGEEQPVILYDIHRGKLHHRHVGRREYPYRFSSVDQLIVDFRADMERIKAARRRSQP